MINWHTFAVMMLISTGAAAFVAGIALAVIRENPMWMLWWVWPVISWPLAIAMCG